jgi:raffinose/stachyose/melibiose transport system substrate-binding protein
VVAAVLVAGLLGACGTPDDRPHASGPLTILVPSSAVTDGAFEALNTSFEAAYPDVELRFSTVEPEEFSAARTAALADGSVDITAAQPRETPDWVTNDSDTPESVAARSGVFVDLSRKPFLQHYIPSIVDQLRYNGKAYAVPIGITYSTGVFYNADLFARLNLEVPTTWHEFLAVANALKDAGETPLGIAGSDGRGAELCMLAVVQSTYPTAAEKVALAESIWRNRSGLATGKQLQVVKRIGALYSLADPDFGTIASETIPASFADGDYAMTIDGTSDLRAIEAAVGDRFDYGYFPLPAGDDAGDNTRLGAGLELGLVAAEDGPNPTAALAYLDYLSRPGPYGRFINMTGFASTQSTTTPDNAFLRDIGRYTGVYSPAWDTIWTPNLAAGPAALAPFDFADIAPLGPLTPEQAAERSQSDWDLGR